MEAATALHSTQLRPPTFLPLPPIRMEDVDVSETLLTDIALRHVYQRGTCSIHLLSDLMKLPPEVAEVIFRRLNDQQYFEVRRMAGDDYIFSLSGSGRRLAAERALTTRYAGPAPVSLKSWTAAVRRQAAEDLTVNREKLRLSFADIVLPDELLDALGPALISQRAMFLYGPSGTGKSTISERLIRVFDDAVAVPYAVEVEGQIITLMDPAVHEAVEIDGLAIDPRWVVCRRPFLAVGGELVTGMLDLQKDESTGSFIAPLQMKANNGILLIDDFGRQLMSPRDLLNRWIVPLDRRVDFLSLGSGKFDIPFELLVLFSTNLEPHELADEAFLRRIPNKILIKPCEAAAFDIIFGRAAAAAGLECEPGSAEYCRELCLRHSPDLRPCFPRDLCSAIRAITLYEGRKPAVTRADLERAVAGYFV
jgi:hypothetical protein